MTRKPWKFGTQGLRAWIYYEQGRQELNPQPTVLETVALPIELHPYPSTF